MKKFKNPILTLPATRILGVNRHTLWNWADAGKIRMYRLPITGTRIFDGDELKVLAPRINKDRNMGRHGIFPQKKKPK